MEEAMDGAGEEGAAVDEMVPKRDYDSLKHMYDSINVEYGNLRQEFYAVQDENKKLKEELAHTKYSYLSVRNCAAQFVFLTGLTTILFDWLLSKVESSVKKLSQVLSLEDHLLIVLMKLRLGLTNSDIAYRFKVSKGTISNILRSWLPILAKALKPLIRWPSKRAVVRKMPKCFKLKFKRCRCIIDCTEIFIERPTNLTSRAQTWSNYKHHNTVKYLVGITPGGAISFLSPGWGGRVSDKEITKKSGFLDLVEPRDEILADRGFLIRDELAMCGATLRIPHFTKGKRQLPAYEVDTSRQLSRARIHIERVIGRWKNFRILQSIVPVSQADLLDDIVIVCGALTNLSKSVVPRR